MRLDLNDDDMVVIADSISIYYDGEEDFYDNLSFHEGNFHLSSWSGNYYVYEGPGWGGWHGLSPSFGTIPAGGSMDVTVTYDSEWLDKGEYQSTENINSNDLTDPVLWSHHTMRVTGTPEFYVYGSSDTSGMDLTLDRYISWTHPMRSFGS